MQKKLGGELERGGRAIKPSFSHLCCTSHPSSRALVTAGTEHKWH